MQCDLNCDMGEGIGNDELIMPYITSANIACGYHAGDEETMKKTVLLAKKYNVNIGAHPSFLDRQNFGRTEMGKTPVEVYELVSAQINLLQKITIDNNAQLHHVKPHGALYNMAAKDKGLAKSIVEAVKDLDKNLILYCLSNSFLISEAKAIGLKTASEAFADRTYQDDGSLTPRSQPDALIQNTDEALQQVLMMVNKGKVRTVSGKVIPIVAETICIHGDGNYAVEFARAIHEIF
ncbi:MAG TPA: 5-oxoprolinase subunit PxpA [Chitinophagaceae bacterium]|nr:5-oxoprolinase subunit PxpA [Chitinophagaceae bacterium]